MSRQVLVIDFDSTFIKVETLDILGEISLEGHPERDERLKKIADVTNLGMNGELSFLESLKARIEILDAKKEHLTELVERLKKLVSTSFVNNTAFLKANAKDIYIVSSGFKEFITPVVADYGISADHVYANTFEFDIEGNIVNFDNNNPLSQDQGKIKLMESLKIEGEISVIGDGYTDYEIRKAGLAKKFFAFCENVKRDKVVKNADFIVYSFDEVLYENKMPMATTSYPKSKIKILLLENIHPDAAAAFREEGFQVETVVGALDEAELCEKIKDVHVIGIRSKTNITKTALAHANKLMAVGAFCIGTNQIDLEACTEKGVAVFNAPYSNTRSVVELAIGEIIMLMRGIPNKDKGMHEGKWNKSATNSFEVRRKKLGIIGYGNIGAQLSVVAEAMGMEVYFYDVVDKLALGTAKKCSSMKELLQKSDIVSLHVDGRPSNKNFFGKEEFDLMKEGSYFLNLARGPVVEIEALVEALKSGKVIGAGVDVFPTEPKTNKDPFESELIGLDNVILTPHIGGSTAEAQENIGEYVPSKLISYINTGTSYGSVNFPNLQLPKLKDAHRLIHIHLNKPGVLAKINEILAKYNANILGQYLKTVEGMGYVITDIDQRQDQALQEELKGIEGTLKFRILY
ncbi:MAG: phosphoglycerate dehydrogenase [Cytophagales bacterium]|nr:phosphoglycerate dehydrogenase [Cytophagales bacterium]